MLPKQLATAIQYVLAVDHVVVTVVGFHPIASRVNMPNTTTKVLGDERLNEGIDQEKCPTFMTFICTIATNEFIAQWP